MEELTDDDLRAMLSEDAIAAHRRRALSPDHPVLRGTAQNPDVFFQAREAANAFHTDCPQHVQDAMDRFARLTGRAYRLFDYVGDPLAERVIVIMGSGAETVETVVDSLVAAGEKVGVLKVRLYRPFALDAFIGALPATTKAIAVMDRTKEPGAIGDPLFLDVVAALNEDGTRRPKVIGGRYGLASKEFTPAMAKAIYG
jgi:pyruvate-ferredoxin/flavodoxin oxidoreductase